MASWPVIVVLRQQQLTLLLFLLLTAGLYARARGWLVLAGVLMGLSIMKPQLALLPLVWEMATAIRGREWRLLASMVGTGLFLFLSADLLHPGWLREWVIGLMRYRQYTGSQPAMELWFGAWVGGALLIVVTAVAFVALWRQRNDEARRTSPLVLALTVTLCPTTVYWIYNQILLLPACLLLVFDDPETRVSAILRRITFALLGWGFLAVALAILVETVLQPNLLLDLLPCFNYLLPLLLTIALSLPYLAKKPRVKASPVTVDEGELMFAVD
jgi:hypothetical protein